MNDVRATFSKKERKKRNLTFCDVRPAVRCCLKVTLVDRGGNVMEISSLQAPSLDFLTSPLSSDLSCNIVNAS